MTEKTNKRGSSRHGSENVVERRRAPGLRDESSGVFEDDLAADCELQDSLDEPMMQDERPSHIQVVSEGEVWAGYEAQVVVDAERKAHRRLRDQQREVMVDSLLSGRFDEDDLCAMIQIGCVTLDERTLPCDDPTRTDSIAEWDQRFEESLRAEERGERLALSPAQHDCPLQARALVEGAPLPCIEAQRAQAAHLALRGEVPVGLLSEDDPVVACELRPCVFLGREQLLNVYLLQEDRRRKLRLGCSPSTMAQG